MSCTIQIIANFWAVLLSIWYLIISNKNFSPLNYFFEIELKAQFQLLCQIISLICGLIKIHLIFCTINKKTNNNKQIKSSSTKTNNSFYSIFQNPNQMLLVTMTLSWITAICLFISLCFDTSVINETQAKLKQFNLHDLTKLQKLSASFAEQAMRYSFYNFHYWFGWAGAVLFLVTPCLEVYQSKLDGFTIGDENDKEVKLDRRDEKEIKLKI